MKWKTETEISFFPNPSRTSVPNWIPNGFLTQRSSHSALGRTPKPTPIASIKTANTSTKINTSSLLSWKHRVSAGQVRIQMPEDVTLGYNSHSVSQGRALYREAQSCSSEDRYLWTKNQDKGNENEIYMKQLGFQSCTRQEVWLRTQYSRQGMS